MQNRGKEQENVKDPFPFIEYALAACKLTVDLNENGHTQVSLPLYSLTAYFSLKWIILPKSLRS